MADLGGIQNAPLTAYQQHIRQVMVERGFDDETVSQKFMLLLEQAGEFAQAARKQANLAQSTDASIEDCSDAAADVFAVLLDICNQMSINLEQAFIAREYKNQDRTWQ